MPCPDFIPCLAPTLSTGLPTQSVCRTRLWVVHNAVLGVIVAPMNKTLTIAIAQFNLVVGDLEANAERIVKAAEDARVAGAALLITPELALSGYPPEDLLLRPDFYRACALQLECIAALTRSIDLVLVVGHPFERDGRRTRSNGMGVDSMPLRCCAPGVSKRPISSASSRTTRCSTRSAISPVASAISPVATRPVWSRYAACGSG